MSDRSGEVIRGVWGTHAPGEGSGELCPDCGADIGWANTTFSMSLQIHRDVDDCPGAPAWSVRINAAASEAVTVRARSALKAAAIAIERAESRDPHDQLSQVGDPEHLTILVHRVARKAMGRA